MTTRRNPSRRKPEEHEAPKLEFSGTTPYDAYVGSSTLAHFKDPVTDEPGEMMFLVMSQVMELYFRLIAFEWRTAQRFLRDDNLHDALVALRRSRDTFTALNASWVTFRWMTPPDFNSFRESLGEASGFQSFLYRHLEFLLGFKDPALLRPHKQVAGDNYAELVAAFEAPSLYDDVLAYLARHGYAVPADVLSRDMASTYEHSDGVEDVWVTLYEGTDAIAPERQLAELLTDLAQEFSDWRYWHLMAVRRAMGAKAGTGGSSGLAWLERSLQRQAFPELWSSRTRI